MMDEEHEDDSDISEWTAMVRWMRLSMAGCGVKAWARKMKNASSLSWVGGAR